MSKLITLKVIYQEPLGDGEVLVRETTEMVKKDNVPNLNQNGWKISYELFDQGEYFCTVCYEQISWSLLHVMSFAEKGYRIDYEKLEISKGEETILKVVPTDRDKHNMVFTPEK